MKNECDETRAYVDSAVYNAPTRYARLNLDMYECISRKYKFTCASLFLFWKIILRYDNKKESNCEALAYSYDDLAVIAMCDYSTAKQAILSLINQGLILVTDKHKGGRKKPNTFQTLSNYIKTWRNIWKWFIRAKMPL